MVHQILFISFSVAMFLQAPCSFLIIIIVIIILVFVSVQFLFSEFCHFSCTNYSALFIAWQVKGFVFSPPSTTLNVIKCPSFCFKKIESQPQIQFYLHLFSQFTVWNQNEYCQVYWQQLLYGKLIQNSSRFTWIICNTFPYWGY